MKVLKVLYYAVLFLLIVWFAASYIDIVADNISFNPVHHPWNMFLVMKGWNA